MKERISAKKYYLVYTAVFAAIALCIYGQFVYYGKTMIENYDALHQYYASFEYFSDYVQSIVRTLFTTGKLEIPLWDFTIGMGSDVLTTLNYYVIGDPLNIVAAFFKNSQLEIVFQLLIIFRLYLAGIGFSAFCRKLGYKNWSTIVGACMYTFTVFSLYSAVQYAAFPNALIYLPLLLIGVEKVFRGESGYVLLFSTALCLASNFYFSYMLAILTLIYCVVRYCVSNLRTLKEIGKSTKEIFKDLVHVILKMLIPVVFGVLISSAILFPVLYMFLNQGRSSGQSIDNFLVYGVQTYIEIFGSMFSPKISADFNLMGYCPIVFFAIIMIFGKSNIAKKEKSALRIFYIICAALLLIPLLGYAMNGFSYLNSRWIFGLAFLCAFSVVLIIEELVDLDRKNMIALVCGTLVYCAIYLLIDEWHTGAIANSVIWMFALLLLIIVLNKVEVSKIKKEFCLIVACLICVAYYGFFFYSPQETKIMNSKLDANATQNLEKANAAGAVTEIEDNSFYRVDIKDESILNEAFLLGYPSVAYYYSLFDGKVSEFNDELNNAMMTLPNLSHGNGGRTYLNILTKVKYLVQKETDKIPYGYKYYDNYELEDGTKVNICKNKNALPFGYTVSKYYPKSEYMELTPLKREQTMLQGAVMEENTYDMKELKPKYSDDSLKYKVVNSEYAQIKGNTIYVTQKNAVVELKVNVPKKSELFVSCTGIKFTQYPPEEYPQYYGAGEMMSRFQKVMWNSNYKNWSKSKEVVIEASVGAKSQGITLHQDNFKYYWGRESLLLSLGTRSSGERTIKLRFSEVGEYKFTDLKVLIEDLTVIPEQVEKLKTETLKDVEFSSNRIEGTVETAGERLLMLSVPYTEGWKVTVDGKEQELACANTMWSAVYLEDEGAHKIVLTYETPWLRVSAMISLFSMFVVACYYCVSRYRDVFR